MVELISHKAILVSVSSSLLILFSIQIDYTPRKKSPQELTLSHLKAFFVKVVEPIAPHTSLCHTTQSSSSTRPRLRGARGENLMEDAINTEKIEGHDRAVSPVELPEDAKAAIKITFQAFLLAFPSQPVVSRAEPNHRTQAKQ